MNLGIQQKTAFVAGASSGIGEAIAHALAQEGCNLMLCARRKNVLEALGADLAKTHGITVHTFAADLDNASEIEAAVSETKEHFGGVDILVTNNGGPPPGDFESMTEAQWELGWNRTFMSTVRLIQGFLPEMKANRWGRIVNITSIAVKQPVARLLLSNAYRAGVTGMAKTLSNEIAEFGITVNNIAPGYIETDRLKNLLKDRAVQQSKSEDEVVQAQRESVPAKRIGRPEELASLAAYLASEQAGYISGTTIQVDGGLHKGLL